MTKKRPVLSILLLAILSFIWGSSFILMLLGMIDSSGNPVFSAFQVGALRISLAFLLMLPFALYHFKKVPRNKIFPIFCVGLFGNCIPAFLFTTAETELAPSLAGMLNSTTPLFVVLIAILVFKNKLSLINYIGLLLGFVGSALLMLANGTDEFYGDVGHSLLILIATFCYAISVNIIRNYLVGLAPIAVTSISFLFVGIPTTIYLLSTDFFQVLTQNPSGLASFGYVFLLAFFGTALAVLLFNYLVQLTNAVYASTVTYLIPITAIFWGLINNESINFSHVIGMLIILTGVYLINKT